MRHIRFGPAFSTGRSNRGPGGRAAPAGCQQRGRQTPSDGERWRSWRMAEVARLRGTVQIAAPLPRLVRLEQGLTRGPGALGRVGQAVAERAVVIVPGMATGMIAAKIGGPGPEAEREGLVIGRARLGGHEHGGNDARQCQQHAETQNNQQGRPFPHGRLVTRARLRRKPRNASAIAKPGPQRARAPGLARPAGAPRAPTGCATLPPRR